MSSVDVIPGLAPYVITSGRLNVARALTTLLETYPPSFGVHPCELLPLVSPPRWLTLAAAAAAGQNHACHWRAEGECSLVSAALPQLDSPSYPLPADEMTKQTNIEWTLSAGYSRTSTTTVASNQACFDQ